MMKQLVFAGMVVALAGCVQVDHYDDVVKAPAPAGLEGYWQSKGPQSEMMSPDAIASLIVTKNGDTLDCRQWQRVIATPGHTSDHLTYLIGDALFVGDTLFMPDYGTARCDFPGGSAAQLYRSIRRILSLPEATTLYMCHDYQPGGREVQFVSTVAEQREHNVHVRNGISEEEFVAMRTKRDASMDMPTLILPSVQVNMRAGHMPPAEANGVRYLKIPLNAV